MVPETTSSISGMLLKKTDLPFRFRKKKSPLFTLGFIDVCVCQQYHRGAPIQTDLDHMLVFSGNVSLKTLSTCILRI